MHLPGDAEALAGFNPGLQRWLRVEARWPGLTPVQRAAAAPILAGHDCIVEAPTAGGKTEAVLFPALTRVADDAGTGVRILYLAPLRALLNNLQGRGEHYAALCNLRAFKWHGDVGQKEKLEALRDPPHLLLTTPESLEAILLRKAGWKDLFAGLRIVIIDEAHNFAAGDRGGHLLSLLERLAPASARPPQRIALSATLGSPEAMQGWLGGPNRAPGVRIAIEGPPRPDRDFRVHLFEEAMDDEDTPPAERATFRRFEELRRLVAEPEGDRPARSLVFVRSRSGAESLASAVVKMNAGLTPGRRLQVRTHHSAVSKYFREEAEALIQIASEDGLHAILSTSTLELGIDIGILDRVIQVDALASPGSLLQRVGRTGRRPGRPQYFRGLVKDTEDLLVLMAAVNLALAGRPEALLLPRRAFHLLAHQLLCLSLQSFGIAPDDAWQTLRGAHCFSAIEAEEFAALVEHMVEAGYLRRVDCQVVVGEKTEEAFLHSNWRRLFAVFDSAPLYEVMHHRRQVGTLDAKFVEVLEAPFLFVLGGKLWSADRVSHEERLVHASPSEAGTAPTWQTFGGPGVPFETAQEAGRLLWDLELPDFLDAEALAAFVLEKLLWVDGDWAPGKVVAMSAGIRAARVITFAGDRINRTLARFLTLRGVGQTSASYAEVEIRKGPREPGALKTALDASLAELREGDFSDPTKLTRLLEEHQPLWPFSPFARCLPPNLWAAALVEQSLDVAGLLRLILDAGSIAWSESSS